MTNREKRIHILSKTIESHLKVGNDFMAATMEKSLKRFEAITDAEYDQWRAEEEANYSPKWLETRKQITEDFFGTEA